jgi:hypothetical protein
MGDEIYDIDAVDEQAISEMSEEDFRKQVMQYSELLNLIEASKNELKIARRKARFSNCVIGAYMKYHNMKKVRVNNLGRLFQVRELGSYRHPTKEEIIKGLANSMNLEHSELLIRYDEISKRRVEKQPVLKLTVRKINNA